MVGLAEVRPPSGVVKSPCMAQELEYSSKIKHLFEVVTIYDDVPTFLESIKDVPNPLLLLYAAHFCLSEVHNGGFLQLSWNSTGVLLPEAVDGYKALGMPKLASTFTSAATCLGSSYARNRDDRWDALLQASGRTENELTAIFRFSSVQKTSILRMRKPRLRCRSTLSTSKHGSLPSPRMVVFKNALAATQQCSGLTEQAMTSHFGAVPE